MGNNGPVANGDAQRMNAQRPTLVGREEELTRLADMADAAVEFGVQMVLLSGDAGIGKSTLTAEFLSAQAASGWACHVGHCIEYADRSLPFGPVVSVLRSVLLDNLEHVDEIIGPHREDLAGLLPELGDDEERPSSLVGDVDRLFDAIAAVLTHAARVRPVAVLIEDVHWADPATRDLLASLVHALGSSRVLLLVTERSGALPRSHPLRVWLAEQRRFPNVHSIELEGLSIDELAAQATAVLGEAPESELVEALHTRTEGNPYFSYEFLIARRAGGGDELPSSLREFLISRLETLSADEREVVQAIAIAGGVVAHPFLVAMLPDTAMGDVVRSLFDKSVVKVEGQEYTFAHGLVREAILTEVLPFEAEDLHRRTAETLETVLPAARSLSDAVTLAIHWDKGAVADKTIETSVAAADAAAKVAAFDTASDMLLQAARAWTRAGDPVSLAGMERDDLVVKASEWLSSCYRGEEAVALLSSASDSDWGRALPAPKRGRLLAVQAMIDFDLGDPALAADLLAQAEELVGDTVAPESATVFHRVSNFALRGGTIQPAREAAERAIEIAAEVGPHRELIEATVTLGLALGVTEDRDAGVQKAREARELALAAGLVAQVARAYRIEWLIVYTRDGLTSGTFDVSQAGLAYTETHCGPRARAEFRVDLARSYVEAGRLREAGPYLDLLMQSEVDELRRLTVLQASGLCNLGRGDLSAAAEVLDEATDIADRFQSASETGYQNRILAELARRQGRLDEARKHVEIALDLQLTSDNQTYTRETITELVRIANACALAGRSDADELGRLSAELVSGFVGPGLANQAMRATMDLELAALQGSVDETQAAHTLDLLRQAGFLYEVAQAELLVVDDFVSRGEARSDVARRHIRALHELANVHGMDWIAERARSLASIARVDVGLVVEPEDDHAVRELPHGLTQREVEVMALLAEGLTNKAIGAELYVSPRTVSTHISNLLAKLGVSNRGEAAAAFHRLSLQEALEDAPIRT